MRPFYVKDSVTFRIRKKNMGLSIDITINSSRKYDGTLLFRSEDRMTSTNGVRNYMEIFRNATNIKPVSGDGDFLYVTSI